MIKKLTTLIVLNIIFFFIFSTQTEAFLAASGITIIASSFLPGILIIIVNALLTFLALIKKNKFLFIILFGMLIILISFFVGRYLALKEINKFPSIGEDLFISANGQDDGWNEFRQNLEKSTLEGTSKYRFALKYSDSEDSFKVTSYNIEDYTKIIGYTLSDFRLEGTDINLGGYWFVQIFNYAFDKKALVSFLEKNNITEDDRILFYCPGGYTSRVAAFILIHYGYDAKYLPLSELDDITVEQKQDFSLDNNNSFIIKSINIGELEEQKYIYFMLTINDYYYYYLNNYFCNELSLPKNIKLFDAYDYFDKNIIPCGKKKDSSFKISDLKIPVFDKEVHKEQLMSGKILCHDKWHCFLTKHFLYEQKLKDDFSTLYCLECGK